MVNIFQLMKLKVALDACPKDDWGHPLVCSGCSHSNPDLPFPGGPAGERPSFFCIRNTKREEWQKEFKERHGKELDVWYDGSNPVKVPMDCYHSVDMLDQINQWPQKWEVKQTPEASTHRFCSTCRRLCKTDQNTMGNCTGWEKS